MGKTKATWVGFTAVLMWGALAALTIGSAPVPPLQLNAICFGIGGLIGLIWMAARSKLLAVGSDGGGGIGIRPVAAIGGFSRLRGVSWKVYAFGTAGLFGYHLIYFTAFRLAPYAQTSLIAYLWPLFIVLFSGLLPGERLRPLHLIGAAVAFAGAALIVLGRGAAMGPGAGLGMALAFLCALTWAGYSILSRRLGEVPTEAVTLYCLATAVLSALCHLALETTAWPATSAGWGSVLALGLGPVGLAFFTWDVGMKRGDIQLLGTLSYAAPLLSTLILVATGGAELTASLALAALLITVGAGLAARA